MVPGQEIGRGGSSSHGQRAGVALHRGQRVRSVADRRRLRRGRLCDGRNLDGGLAPDDSGDPRFLARRRRSVADVCRDAWAQREERGHGRARRVAEGGHVVLRAHVATGISSPEGGANAARDAERATAIRGRSLPTTAAISTAGDVRRLVAWRLARAQPGLDRASRCGGGAAGARHPPSFTAMYNGEWEFVRTAISDTNVHLIRNTIAPQRDTRDGRRGSRVGPNTLLTGAATPSHPRMSTVRSLSRARATRDRSRAIVRAPGSPWWKAQGGAHVVIER